jgi:hypothetical protein
VTVIVAWKCNDGVVVGADSAATLGSGGQTTVKESCSKLEVIKNALVLGVSGPVSLAQKYEQAFQSIPDPDFAALCGRPCADAVSTLSGVLWSHAAPAYQRAGHVTQMTGNRAYLQDAEHSTVMALRINDEDA